MFRERVYILALYTLVALYSAHALQRGLLAEGKQDQTLRYGLASLTHYWLITDTSTPSPCHGLLTSPFSFSLGLLSYSPDRCTPYPFYSTHRNICYGYPVLQWKLNFLSLVPSLLFDQYCHRDLHEQLFLSVWLHCEPRPFMKHIKCSQLNLAFQLVLSFFDTWAHGHLHKNSF